MVLSELTNKIVEARETKAKTFASYRSRLNAIKDTLDFVTSLKENPLWEQIIEESSKKEKWCEIIKRVTSLSEELDSFIGGTGDFTIAESRASRTFVNIGAIGIMREGKSEFVAQITKLDQWVLPRKRGEHACTTSSINVINGSSLDGKSDIVRVYYYTISDIVCLFGDYLEEFGLNRSLIDGRMIRTRKELKDWCKFNKERMERDIPSTQGKLKQKFLEYLRACLNFAQ